MESIESTLKEDASLTAQCLKEMVAVTSALAHYLSHVHSPTPHSWLPPQERFDSAQATETSNTGAGAIG
jgi:hypothetical protein